jgi:hypothetical protein
MTSARNAVSVLVLCFFAATVLVLIGVLVSNTPVAGFSEGTHEALIVHVLYSSLFVPHYGATDAYASCADVRTRLGALGPALMVSICAAQETQGHNEATAVLRLATCLCPDDQRPAAHNDFRGFAIVAHTALFPLGVWNCERTVALLPDAAALDYVQNKLCAAGKLGLQSSCLCNSSLNFVSTRDARLPCASWTSAPVVTASYGSVAVAQLLTLPQGGLELLLLPADNVNLLGVALQGAPNATIVWPPSDPVAQGESFLFHFEVCLPECETAVVSLELPCGG